MDVEFTVPYDKAEYIKGFTDDPVIPPQGLKRSLPLIRIETKSEDVAAEHNTALELVESAKLVGLNTKMLIPVGDNFDLLDSVWIYLSATGVSEELVAHKFDIPKGLQTIELTPEDVDIQDMFKQKEMIVRIEGHFNEKPDSTSKILFDMKLRIVANPLD